MAILGNSTSVSSSTRSPSGQCRGIQFTTTEIGTLTDIHARVSATGAHGMGAFLFDASGNLLASSTQRTDISSSVSWETFTGFSYELADATTYFALILANPTDTTAIAYDIGASFDGYLIETGGGSQDPDSPPDGDLPSIDGSARDYAVYITYTEGGGADVTGTGSPSVAEITMSGSGNVSTPGGGVGDVYSVGGAVTLVLGGGYTTAGSGLAYTANAGSGAGTIPTTIMSGSGTVFAVFTGTGALDVPSVLMSGSGLAISTLSGSGTPATAAVTLAGSGEVVTPGFVTGTGALTIGQITMSGLDTPPWGDGPFVTELDWFMYRRRKWRRYHGR